MLQVRRILLAAVAIAGVPLGAQEIEVRVVACAAIESAVERLDCFDRLAESLDPMPVESADSEEDLLGGLGLETPTSTMIAGWEVVARDDPMDDSRTVTIAKVAESGVNRMGDSPAMLVRCRSGRTELFIDWGDYLGNGSAVVTFRVGEDDPEREPWTISTDSRASFMPGEVREYVLGKLLNAERFVARVTPYSESPVTAIFALDGFSTAITPVLEACPRR